MEKLTRQHLAFTTLQRWKEQYADTKMLKHNETQKRLAAIQYSDLTPAKIYEVIGNDSWTYLQCDECETPKEEVMQLHGGDGNFNICSKCISRANAMIGNIP